MKLPTVLLTAVLLAACSTAPDAPERTATPAEDPATLGTVSGRIVVDGTVPPAEVIRLDADPKCVELSGDEERRAEYVVMGDGNTLQNVFVYVKDGVPGRVYPAPSEPVVLDQQRCRYVPRVLGIQIGQPLTIRNSDPLLHNVRAEGAINEPFDIGTPVQGVEATRTFVTREVMVPVKCNVHAWMNAYIGVLEHPYYAVSDDSGRFTLPPLPAGTYTVEIWHERFGTQTQQVTVTPQQTRELSFTYQAS